jgi:hypothetical protein
MSTITAEEQAKIKAYLDTHVLPKGIGSEESACSIAAINLSLYGKLTDNIPDCMSNIIGRWIIRVQDSMPGDMRNSAKWKILLPMAAGTGRREDDEKRRIKIVMNWMWDVVLPHLQPIADKRGYGSEWKAMTDDKTSASSYEAKKAAYAAAAYAAADAAAYATAAADADAYAYAAAAYAAADAKKSAWEHFDPCSLLENLIDA